VQIFRQAAALPSPPHGADETTAAAEDPTATILQEAAEQLLRTVSGGSGGGGGGGADAGGDRAEEMQVDVTTAVEAPPPAGPQATTLAGAAVSPGGGTSTAPAGGTPSPPMDPPDILRVCPAALPLLPASVGKAVTRGGAPVGARWRLPAANTVELHLSAPLDPRRHAVVAVCGPRVLPMSVLRYDGSKVQFALGELPPEALEGWPAGGGGAVAATPVPAAIHFFIVLKGAAAASTAPHPLLAMPQAAALQLGAAAEEAAENAAAAAEAATAASPDLQPAAAAAAAAAQAEMEEVQTLIRDLALALDLAFPRAQSSGGLGDAPGGAALELLSGVMTALLVRGLNEPCALLLNLAADGGWPVVGWPAAVGCGAPPVTAEELEAAMRCLEPVGMAPEPMKADAPPEVDAPALPSLPPSVSDPPQPQPPPPPPLPLPSEPAPQPFQLPTASSPPPHAEARSQAPEAHAAPAPVGTPSRLELLGGSPLAGAGNSRHFSMELSEAGAGHERAAAPAAAAAGAGSVGGPRASCMRARRPEVVSPVRRLIASFDSDRPYDAEDVSSGSGGGGGGEMAVARDAGKPSASRPLATAAAAAAAAQAKAAAAAARMSADAVLAVASARSPPPLRPAVSEPMDLGGLAIPTRTIVQSWNLRDSADQYADALTAVQEAALAASASPGARERRVLRAAKAEAEAAERALVRSYLDTAAEPAAAGGGGGGGGGGALSARRVLGPSPDEYGRYLHRGSDQARMDGAVLVVLAALLAGSLLSAAAAADGGLSARGVVAACALLGAHAALLVEVVRNPSRYLRRRRTLLLGLRVAASLCALALARGGLPESVLVGAILRAAFLRIGLRGDLMLQALEVGALAATLRTPAAAAAAAVWPAVAATCLVSPLLLSRLAVWALAARD